MRIEQIIAAVTRTLVITKVRGIQAVRSFVTTTRLHQWRPLHSLGMPVYSASRLAPGWMSGSPLRADADGDASGGGKRCSHPGKFRFPAAMSPAPAIANCPAGNA